MRLLIQLSTALALAAGLLVAVFALLHLLPTPERPTSKSPAFAALPPMKLAPQPRIDKVRAPASSVWPSGIRNAAHKSTLSVTGTISPAREGVRVLLLDEKDLENASDFALGNSGRSIAERRKIAAAARFIQMRRPDASGRFRFEGLTAGQYELRVLSASGRNLVKPVRVHIKRGLAHLELELETGLPKLSLKLWHRGNVMSGKKPIANAQLVLQTMDGSYFCRKNSNEAGVIELVDVPKKLLSYCVRVSHAKWQGRVREWRGEIDLTNYTEENFDLRLNTVKR